MTGFGRSQGQAAWGAWAWEARSVNGKSLDVRVASPPGFDAVDFEAKKKVRERFARGSVQLQLRVDFTRDESGPSIDSRALARLARTARSWSTAGLAKPALEGLLAAPGIVRTGSRAAQLVDEGMAADLLASLDQALDGLAEARRGEGEALMKLFASMLDQIGETVVRAGELASTQPELVRERFRSRLTELAGEGGVEPERVMQEAAVLAAKADVREELDRLAAHIESARKILVSGEAAGRKLDFLCQEFNREANTLCSKSASLELTNAGLSLKSVIDQFREQVQNVE
ncbi:MAG: YicC family protein [Alphaproteobacteria bacterium]|nr:YicC family protein [Alphaproteobacteria bacterium]